MDVQQEIEFIQRHLVETYNPPLDILLQHGKGCRVWDRTGRQYIDMLACYSAQNAGHSHPEIIQALTEQIKELGPISNNFYHSSLAPLLRELVGICGDDKKFLFTNTGAEAWERAVFKIARKWGYVKKGIPMYKAKLVVARDNFHGRTLGAISASDEPHYRYYFGPFLSGIISVPFGNAKALERKLNKERNITAVCLEPVQMEGGVIIPPLGYLTQVKELCRKYNVLFILDEIQTGLGRTGKIFAWQHDGAKPDLLILGKFLGSVYPVSLVAGPADIMDVLEPGEDGSTFARNPIACKVATATLRVLRKEKLAQKATNSGKYFLERLQEIKSPLIKEVRGIGLAIGIEFKPDANIKEIWSHLVHADDKEPGILCALARHNVIRFTPPLVITSDEIDLALRKIARVLEVKVR